MSEILNNSTKRKDALKDLLLQLHRGETVEALRKRLIAALQQIPYNEVVEVEQELIGTGRLSADEVLKFCDLHSAVLDGNIDFEKEQKVPAGHPVDTFNRENSALKTLINNILILFEKEISEPQTADYILELRTFFNALWDVDKHYKRKEYLLFPYLEKHEINSPPKVMWGKDDEIRGLLKTASETLAKPINSLAELKSAVRETLLPAVEMLDSMIGKEEQILLPMSLDTLSEAEWYRIYRETPQFGYCLIDGNAEWKPDLSEEAETETSRYFDGQAIQLSSGTFDIQELEAFFQNLPFDVTFVDKNDKVRFFSHSPRRIFERNLSIIGRDVRMCHPPGSVHVVERILSDFKSGRQNKAAFWLSNFKGRFIYIEYTAVRCECGSYLGTLEVTQDITEFRNLQGDRRLLSYEYE